MNRLRLSYFYILSFVLVAVGLQGCIEDGFSTSSSDRLTFSVDTLDMGTFFTEDVSTTHRFTVYNRSNKSLNIGNIHLDGPNAGLFRLNVDGFSGTDFTDVEIRANDSIFILVSTTLPPNGVDEDIDVFSAIKFLTNGVESTVTLKATGRDVERARGWTLSGDVTFSGTKPYQIFDSLVVARGATLTLPAGARLYFHDGARMVVHGRLEAHGDTGREVILSGDRTGFVAGDISFDIMSRQWQGLQFTTGSHGAMLRNTQIYNTVDGVAIDSVPETDFTMINCVLRNSGNTALRVRHANLRAYGCELAEAPNGILLLDGGSHVLNHCTLANYYLFTAISAPLLQFATDAEERPTPAALIQNCILYGLGSDLPKMNFAESGIRFERCLFKSQGADDEQFIECLWDRDPLYYTVRNKYYFDYRLRPESPAIAAGRADLTAPESATDRYGLARGATPDLGAYVYTQPEEDRK